MGEYEWKSYDIGEMTAETYAVWHDMMDSERKRRVDGLRNADDRLRTVAGEMLVRQCIAEKLHIDKSKIRIKCDINEKPYADGIPIEFSVSHSGRIAVCAVSDQPIGIDVEQLLPVNLSMAKRIFRSADIQFIFGRTPEKNELTFCDDPEILMKFYQKWTEYEANGKYYGTGLQNTEPLRKSCDRFMIQHDSAYVVSIVQ